MRVRHYGLLLLLAVGILPLAIFGYVAIHRAEETAVAEVRAGNARVAGSVAHELGTYVESEQQLVVAAGEAALQAPDPDHALALLDAFSLTHDHVKDVTVYRPDGDKLAGRGDYPGSLIDEALGGEPARSEIRLAEDGFAHQVTMAEPVWVAGKQEGAVVARVDLLGLWHPIHAVKIGETGFIRLLGPDGELLAHGDPEERRDVFNPDKAKDQRMLVGAFLSHTVENQEGEEVVASAAHVPAIDSFVLVEQRVSEAFAAAAATRRALYVFAAGALVVAVLVGLLAGRAVVRPLEKLRSHTRVLGRGELDARVGRDFPLLEVRALAESLDEMAESLARLQEEAKARERLTTFARVAAGLAHDLQHPVAALRMACEAVLHHPDDPQSRRTLERVAGKDLPRLGRFVQDLRGLARRGEMELELAPIEPRAIAAEIAADLGAAPKWRGVEFEAAGEAGRMYADANLLRRALVNLASNAADACTEKAPQGGRVRLEVAAAADGDDRVAFRVIDNGTGIEKSRLADLLSSDFKSTKRSTGVGLGLGVVRQVVESHGGDLRVESEPGEGATFTLLLPRRGEGASTRNQARSGPGGSDHAQRPQAGAG